MTAKPTYAELEQRIQALGQNLLIKAEPPIIWGSLRKSIRRFLIHLRMRLPL